MIPDKQWIILNTVKYLFTNDNGSSSWTKILIHINNDKQVHTIINNNLGRKPKEEILKMVIKNF